MGVETVLKLLDINTIVNTIVGAYPPYTEDRAYKIVQHLDRHIESICAELGLDCGPRCWITRDFLNFLEREVPHDRLIKRLKEKYGDLRNIVAVAEYKIGDDRLAVVFLRDRVEMLTY